MSTGELNGTQIVTTRWIEEASSRTEDLGTDIVMTVDTICGDVTARRRFRRPARKSDCKQEESKHGVAEGLDGDDHDEKDSEEEGEEEEAAPAATCESAALDRIRRRAVEEAVEEMRERERRDRSREARDSDSAAVASEAASASDGDATDRGVV